MQKKDIFIKFCKWTAETFPFLANKEVKTSKELREALKFLKWNTKPHEVVIASRFVLLVSMVLAILFNIIGLFLFDFYSIIVFTFSIIAPFFFATIISSYPKTQAHLERVNALGYAPTILTQLVVYLKQNPNLEKAIQFVSKYSEGKISDDLKKALWNAYLGKVKNLKEALSNLAEYWGHYLSEFKRSLYLIIASVSEKDERKREQTLDRTIKISLEGILTKIREYTNSLYLPTLFLFSFGTVLPLVIISLLPIISFLGNEFSSPLQIFLLLTFSLIAIYIYSNNIISKRPPTFSSIKLPEKLPGYPNYGNLKIKIGKIEFESNAFLYCTLIFILIGFPGILYLISQIPGVEFSLNLIPNLNTITLIWAFGIAISIYSYGTSWYKKEYRRKAEELEKETIDGMYRISSKLDEGYSPEKTLEIVGGSMPETYFGKFLDEIRKKLKSSHTTLEKAVKAETKEVYSKNVKMIFEVFVNSLKKGVKNCSQMLLTIINHFEDLKKTEYKLRDMLRNAISMMRTTATIFAPMITGLVVTLQKMIEEGIKSAQTKMNYIGYEQFSLSFLKVPSLNIEILQLIAGIYMILLSILLIRYSTILEYGKDEVMIKDEIAKKVPIACFIFTVTLIFSRIVLS